MHRDPWKRRQPALAAVALGAGLISGFFQPEAIAQYAFDPANADEQGDHVRYFGSARDTGGGALQGATILITNKSSSYVFVTDNAGRFRAHLPSDATANKVTVSCSKAEFSLVRVTKRKSPGSAKPSVQVDCVLRAAESNASRS